ncbi:MAG: 1-acyl-sn-glycerol-3-phosphate acyltransferase [Alistipes sp.]|nr:1-acyl-sn-glycerol-3-phosphate acyltransferase [Candidatus Alistipes equi]
MEDIYRDIRPYFDDEIPQAMQRISQDDLLHPVANYLFKDVPFDKVQELILSLKTVEDIQSKLMYPAIKKIADTTISHFTYSGVQNAGDGRGHLFISNHRDITLDAFLLQLALFLNNLPTSDITLGDNLLKPQFVVDICRSNRMIRIIRMDGVSPREFLENSKHLSEYLLKRIEEGRSIWIAQRNGRTKDGLDQTEPGLVRMVGMQSENGFLDTFTKLSIVPISISYEYEPCDVMKAVELFIKRSTGEYHKSEDEDLKSILSGIMDKKGDVHVSICPALTPKELQQAAQLPRSEQFKALAGFIDKRINENYHLHQTNFIACDILRKNDTYTNKYSVKKKEEFIKHLEKCTEVFKLKGIDVKAATEILLRIYANPVLRGEK